MWKTAFSSLVIFAVATDQAHAQATRSTTAIRFTEGATVAVDQAVAVTKAIQASEQAAHREAQGALSDARTQYRKQASQARLELATYDGGRALVDFGLSLGGPAGVATSGVLRATVDRVVRGTIETRIEQAKQTLEVAASAMTDAQWKLVEDKSPDAVKRLEQAMDQTITTARGADLDETERAALKRIVTELAEKSSIESLRQTRINGAAIANLDKRVSSLARNIKDTNTVLAELAHQAQDRDFRTLTAEQKAEVLRKGGMAHVKGEERERLAREVERAASIEAINNGMVKVSSTLTGLSVLAGNILGDKEAARTLSKAARDVETARAVVGMFSAFATGGVLGGLGALGGMGSMFGGGPGQSVDLSGISQQLEEISRDIKEILKNQREMIAQLNDISIRVGEIDAKLDMLSQQLDERTAELLRAIQGVDLCEGFIFSAAFEIPVGKSQIQHVLPFASISEYEIFHTLNRERLDALHSKNTAQCFEQTRRTVSDPAVVRALGRPIVATAEMQTAEIQENRTRYEKARSAYFTRFQDLRRLAAGLQRDGVEPEGMRFALMYPSSSLIGARLVAAQVTAKPRPDPMALPCRWASTFSGTDCDWMKSRATQSHRAALSADEPLYPFEVLRLADYALAVFAQPMAPSRSLFAANATVDQVRARATANIVPGNIGRSAELLDRTTQMLDIAIAHRALYEGDLVSAWIADALMKPPAEVKCKASQADNVGVVDKAFRGAPLRSVLARYPDVAQRALEIVTHKMAFPDLANTRVSEASAIYEWRVGMAPSDWRWGSDARQEKTRAAQNDFWGEWADKSHLEFLYAARLGETVELEIIERVDPAPASETTCNGIDGNTYRKSTAKVQLPASGWYIEVAGMLVPLPHAARLYPIEWTSSTILAQLVERRAAIVGNRWSLVSGTPENVRNAVDYEVISRSIELKRGN